MEEFNFSKAAIKFSQCLTKDMMFTGLRALVQQLGEAVSEGRQLCVDFEFGRLLCNEHDPRFAFAAELYTKEGLPVPNGAVDKLDYAPSVTFAPPSKDALSLNIAGTKAGTAADAVPQKSATPPPPAPPTPLPVAELEEPQENVSQGYPIYDDMDKESRARTPYGSERSTAASSRRLRSEAGAPSDTSETANAKQEAAYREAMDRHINEMEMRAAQAVGERQEWEGHIKQCLVQEREDLNRRRALCSENQDFVKQQMNFNEAKRNQGRKTFIENASAHDFPVFTEPPENELREQMRNQQQRMRQDLDQQVRTNNTLRNIARQRERELEHNQLEANRQEMAMLRSLDNSKKQQQKEVLSSAWNRDIRMRNIWRAIDGHGNAASQQPGGAIDDMGLPPATAGSFASSRSASMSNLGQNGQRIMTGSQRRTPMGAAMSLEKHREKLAKSMA